MTLRAWFKSSGLSQQEAGRLLGVTQSHMSRLLGGRRSPGRSLALDIERATAGAVSVESWDGGGQRRHPRRVPHRAA